MEFQEDILVTAACIDINAKDKNGVKQSSHDTLFSDIWFGGVNTVEEASAEELYYCGTEETSRKGFFLPTLEISKTFFSRGNNIVMNITPRVPGCIPLMAIRYKYNY